MNRTLLPLVTTALDDAGVRYAVIGAAALAAHGVARSTFDLDLFTTDTSALEPDTWASVEADARITLVIRRGDAADPLAGLARLSAPGERDIDVVVGRYRWQTDAVARARPVEIAGLRLPIVTPADLILLKLYAGGSQDRWDIAQLLARDDRDILIDEVSARVDRLPATCQAAWTTFCTRER